MTQNHFTYFLYRRTFQQFSCPEIMVQFAEQPGISPYCTSHHNSITSGLFYQCFCFQRRIYISVSNYRNGNRFFYPADRIPVCSAGIVLLSGAPMHCKCCCSRILNTFRDFNNIYRFILKSDSHLDSQRFTDCR